MARTKLSQHQVRQQRKRAALLRRLEAHGELTVLLAESALRYTRERNWDMLRVVDEYQYKVLDLYLKDVDLLISNDELPDDVLEGPNTVSLSF